MTKLFLIAIGLLLMGSHSVQAKSSAEQCTLSYRPTITVSYRPDAVKYDFTKNSLELDVLGKNAYSPYGEGHKTYFRGLVTSAQPINYEVFFNSSFHSTLKETCLKVDRIEVIMGYQPTVYVSEEYPKTSPIFKNVLEHELSHVEITQNVIQKYAAILRSRLQSDFSGGNAYGFFKSYEIEQGRSNFQRRVHDIVTALSTEMHLENRRQNNR
ncbi:MAG: hypothetical protein AAF988_05900, partial [Pseudomonadota bacterium]